MNEYLSETSYLNYSDEKIQRVLKTDLAIDSIEGAREKAICIHNYVRDSVLFGFNRRFFDMSASQVLEAKTGFCNNKSTLFVAMLRAVGIPSRLHFVDIDKNILHGIVDPRTPFVDHSYTEVYLDGKWIRCDSYIVDSELFKNARKRLEAEKRRLGWGLHIDGTNQWDGRSDSFSQFVFSDAKQISTKDYGVYEDIGEFYNKRASEAWNKPSFMQTCVFYLLAPKFTADIDRVRKEETLNNIS